MKQYVDYPGRRGLNHFPHTPVPPVPPVPPELFNITLKPNLEGGADGDPPSEKPKGGPWAKDSPLIRACIKDIWIVVLLEYS